MFPKRLLPLVAVGAWVSACSGDTVTNIDTPDSGVTATPDSGVVSTPDSGVPVDPAFAKSSKAVLRFKRSLRLRNDLAQTLAIPEGEVCSELGQYSCTDFVHTISLGGVEAYVLGLNEPMNNTTVTTPIATERVVLFACERRARDDLAAGGGAVIFKDLGIQDGKLADVDAEAVGAAIDTLYKRALLRAPTAQEVSHLRQLYRDIEADQQPDPARDWAILTCFSVLTSMESLFY